MRMIATAVLIVAVSAPAAPQGSRLRPPEALQCDRNKLTSFSGAVTHYRRTPARFSIRMSTDDGTRERFEWKGTKAELEKVFLLQGQPFSSADWRKIEKTSSRLHPGVRATVWVCESPSHKMMDWQLPPK